jgi:hypothetical protein
MEEAKKASKQAVSDLSRCYGISKFATSKKYFDYPEEFSDPEHGHLLVLRVSAVIR